MDGNDDKVQSALDEAQQLMNELGVDEGEDVTFSIDSDEEDNNNTSTDVDPKPTDLHPLLDNHPLAATAPSPPAQPQQTAAAMNGAAPAATTGFPQQPPLASGLNSLEQDHNSSAGISASASTSPTTATSAASLGDSWKQQTSRFASAMANMAQRAAHQVVTATQQPPGGVTTAPRSGSSVSSFGSNSAVITGDANNNWQQQQPQQAPMPMAELDNEQKQALIETHVGGLLPGETVIMFLAHLLHVSDSSGFMYTAGPSADGTSSGAIWCCVVTYYRLILFGTHPFTPPPCPADWNTACWPHRPVHLLQMPLASMERIERSVFSAAIPVTGTSSNNNNNTLTSTSLMGLQIVGKDNGRTLRFATANHAETVRAQESLQMYAFPGRVNLGYLFAFESKKNDVMASLVTDPATGQKQVTLPPFARRFEPIAEFQRQFVKGGQQGDGGSGNGQQAFYPWAVYPSVNAHYQLSPTYPSILAGPASLNENNPDSVRVLQQSAAFRSEYRLPVLTYAHRAPAQAAVGGGSLWRCSQPKIGLQGNRSPADEWLLKQILDQAVQANNPAGGARQRQQHVSRQVLVQLTGSSSLEYFCSHWMPSSLSVSGTELKILDLRPRSSAMANRTGGYGYENTSNYPGTTLQFCGIGNIHAVRDAYQKVSAACLSPATSDLGFSSTAVEDSKWLSHLRLILQASWEAAYWIHVWQVPVLLHCSHGWDRTSQVACLAQLLLDPFYRTIEGFACLVEKDFMSFGHPFHMRCSHGVGTNNSGAGGASNVATNVVVNMNGGKDAAGNLDEGQVAPIFLQFLDGVYQLVALYPEAFEFSTRYLLDLSDHVYSCRFGNFLCDTEREREGVAGLRQRTNSVWDFLEARHPSDAATKERISKGGVLLMPLPTLLRNVALWADRHSQYGPKPTQRWLPPNSAPVFAVPENPEGRHDHDTPQFHHIPTLLEAQACLAMSSAATKSTKEAASPTAGGSAE